MLNVGNGITDIGVGLYNLPGFAYNNTIAWFGGGTYRYTEWDWSNGLITSEDPTLHSLSKLAGGLVLLPLDAGVEIPELAIQVPAGLRVAEAAAVNGRRVRVLVPVTQTVVAPAVPAVPGSVVAVGTLGNGAIFCSRLPDGGSGSGGQPVHNAAQDKLLSKGEIKKLEDAGHDIHELKGGRGASRYDLYKDQGGNIFVKPKGGAGEGDPTGININDL